MKCYSEKTKPEEIKIIFDMNGDYYFYPYRDKNGKIREVIVDIKDKTHWGICNQDGHFDQVYKCKIIKVKSLWESLEILKKEEVWKRTNK